VTGSAPQRATADIDIAVAVRSWDQVRELTQGLAATPGVPHKFTVRGVPVDIIPFGSVEDAHRVITWPNDHAMSVLGFAEAMATAVEVRLPHDTRIKVAALPAQALLKLNAWHDRHYQDRRDAIDLRSILISYSEGAYFDELYTRHVPLLERYDFDPQLAGAHRMGAAARTALDESGASYFTELLDRACELLPGHMGGPPNRNQELLGAFCAGLSARQG
jgi:predicted nucleotidyltransferase